MRSPSRRAASTLIALIAAALAATSHQPVRAQASDPFALPDELTLDSVKGADTGPVLSEASIDGKIARRMVHLDGHGDNMTIDAADARTIGLPVAEGASGPVKLSSLRVFKWSFDTLRQRLSVQLFRQNDGVNFRDLAGVERGFGQGTPLLALRVDYDLTAAASPDGMSIGALTSSYLVRGNFSIGTSARFVSDPAPGTRSLVRLDSQAQLAFESRGIVATAGDFVSAGSQSQRSLRMGGIQIGTDSQLRPDLVIMPLPAFSGSIAVPTTLDIVGADQKFALGNLEPGEFTVRNIPAAPGRGTISAILRDSLGRQVVQTSRFYISRDLLAPRRTAYAVNFGFVRRRFGQASDNYGPAAASAYIRRGLSPHLTLEASGEWSAGLVNLGARADFTIANIAKATVEGRISRESRAGTGTLLNLGIESIGPRLGIVAGATLPGATYRDVASKLGDPAPPRQIFANAFYRLEGNSQVQLSYVRRESRAEPELLRTKDRSETFSASGQLPISKRLRLFTAAAWRTGTSGSGYSLSGGLSFNIGPGKHANAYGGVNSGVKSAAIGFTKDDLRDGDIGYRAQANVSDGRQRVLGGVSWRAGAVRLDGEVEQVNGRFAGRANAQGTLLVAGGTVYARNTNSGSYALVRAGDVEGIPILMEHRLVGKTNSEGKLLVQDIPALAEIGIDVDADGLPSDALVKGTEQRLRIHRRAVAVVTIDAQRFVPVMRAIVDGAGAPLSAGLTVRIVPTDEITLTGFDGMVELNAAARNDRLLIGSPGSGCVVDLGGIDLTRDPERPLICRPMTIATDGADPTDVAKADHKPKRVARRN